MINNIFEKINNDILELQKKNENKNENFILLKNNNFILQKNNNINDIIIIIILFLFIFIILK